MFKTAPCLNSNSRHNLLLKGNASLGLNVGGQIWFKNIVVFQLSERKLMLLVQCVWVQKKT